MTPNLMATIPMSEATHDKSLLLPLIEAMTIDPTVPQTNIPPTTKNHVTYLMLSISEEDVNPLHIPPPPPPPERTNSAFARLM